MRLDGGPERISGLPVFSVFNFAAEALQGFVNPPAIDGASLDFRHLLMFGGELTL